MKRAIPWAVLAIPLAGCVTSAYQQVRLNNIFITDGVSVQPYTKAVKLPAASLLGDTLPLTRHINIGMLAKPETAWFAVKRIQRSGSWFAITCCRLCRQ